MQSATPFHTLHGIEETAESRKDAAIDGAQEISVPSPSLGREKKRVVNMMRASCLSIHCLHMVICSKSLGLKLSLNTFSSKCCIFQLIHLKLTEDILFTHLLLRLKKAWWGGERDRKRKRMRQEAQVFQCICPPCHPPRLYSVLSLHSGLGFYGQVQDTPAVNRGTQSPVCLEAASSSLLDVGHLGKLVLLNGKGREIMAKH